MQALTVDDQHGPQQHVQLDAPFAIGADAERDLTWFPLDVYRLSFAIAACVSHRPSDSCIDPNVRLQELRVSFEPGFEWELFGPDSDTSSANEGLRGPFVASLRRPWITRLLSLVFLVITGLFFGALLWPPGTREGHHTLEFFGKSLGFLGVLGVIRGFLVPKAVEAFPLLIDYVALVIFTFVFSLALYRVNLLYRGVAQGEKWVD
jgi:hypothetical protein